MSFATVEDVATRLARDLTAEEGAKAELLLEFAQGAIAASCDKTDAWAAALTPVPSILRLLTVELVVRSMRNPGGLRSQSETLGQYQSSESYADAGNGGGLLLTATEELLVRRVVFGSNSTSVRVESVADDYPYFCGS